MLYELTKRAVPASLKKKARRLLYKLGGPFAEVRHLGPPAAVSLWMSLLAPTASQTLRTVRLSNYGLDVQYRENTSDVAVIKDVFARRPYECVANEKDVSLVIDCGANIGCASLYFLHRYPNAHVIAVEPDSGNFAVCVRNLAPYADRVTLVNAGVWSFASPMVIQRGYRDGGAWAFQVRPTGGDETPDFTATTIDHLLAASNRPTIDVLKIDVERAEVELFRENYRPWLDRTRTLAIELHDTECEEVFFRALADYRYQRGQYGELTICRGLQRIQA
jgi:FkbM family methyltransferase